MDFPGWLHWVDECPSTNTWALTHLEHLAPGTVVFTHRQTAGRGQYDRPWYAPKGVLTASFILELPRSQLTGLSLGAGLAVIHALEALLPDYRDCFGLKWPNDVLIADRKVAGILCETASREAVAQARVVVGVGLNYAVNFAEAGLTLDQMGHAISLHQLSAWLPEELLLLERLRDYLVQMVAMLNQTEGVGLHAYLPELRDRDILRHRTFTLETATERISGQGAGLDEKGRLCLRLADGSLRAFSTGQVLDWRLTASRSPSPPDRSGNGV
ncbi:MAG: biotin--[acetyl-CoA-carboxylase] ligase [Acaryochloridaceae cyanobacterium SU_2_1]|nr:biotin--[acetyl-CoA-carboxylase] ligase [Acaryochloridaceae cyanobacterium SU_2_1]